MLKLSILLAIHNISSRTICYFFILYRRMRIQRLERASNLKLKIDSHKARLIRRLDQNERPSGGKLDGLQTGTQKRNTKVLKSLDLKVEGEKHKGNVIHRKTTDNLQRQSKGEHVQNQKFLRNSLVLLRSVSTNNLTHNNLSLQEKQKLRKAGFNVNAGMFDQKSLQLYNHLKENNAIIDINSETCAISREELLRLFKFFVYFKNDKNLFKLNTNLANPHGIVNEFEKITKIFRAEEAFDYFFDVSKMISSEQIVSVEEKKRMIKLQKYDNEIKKMKQIVEELRQAQTSLEEKLSEASKQMARYEAQQLKIKTMDQQKQSIFNNTYGQEYKKVVEDLQEYAVFLQTKRILRGIKNQLTPFASTQEEIEEQLKTVSKLINYDNELTPLMKIDLIRNFIKRAMEKFKARDEQVREMVEFKTKCITEFVEKMKNWYNNWTFKNEYLSDLKKEFLNIEGKIASKIQFAIQKCTPLQPKKEGEVITSLNEMKNLSKRAVELYMLGHNFY